MAKKQGNGIDLQKNELQNARIQNLASAPSSPVTGQVWFNTTTNRIEFRGSSANIDPTDRANHTGTQAAATILDLAATVQGYRLDQFAAPSQPLSAGGQRIINVATPQSAGDAVPLAYINNLLNGTDWKNSVRAATTANITLSGLQTIDGVVLVSSDRVLVKNQTTASANGIYVAAAGAWARASDADVGTLTSGAACMVTEGTLNGDSQWRLTTDDPISVGSTSLSFTQIGAATVYTQALGIIITGNNIAVDTAVVVRKYSALIGDNATLSIPINHGLNTLDVTVCVYQVSDGAEWDVDILHTSVNAVTAVFAVAPTAGQFRVVVHG